MQSYEPPVDLGRESVPATKEPGNVSRRASDEAAQLVDTQPSTRNVYGVDQPLNQRRARARVSLRDAQQPLQHFLQSAPAKHLGKHNEPRRGLLSSEHDVDWRSALPEKASMTGTHSDPHPYVARSEGHRVGTGRRPRQDGNELLAGTAPHDEVTTPIRQDGAASGLRGPERPQRLDPPPERRLGQRLSIAGRDTHDTFRPKLRIRLRQLCFIDNLCVSSPLLWRGIAINGR